jgi:hypothetical protein
MRLTVSYLPRGICSWHYPVFVSTVAAVLSGVEAVVIVAVVAEALAVRVHAPAGKCHIPKFPFQNVNHFPQ